MPLYNLMEDAATAEICRSQIWQWIRHDANTVEGLNIADHFERLLAEEIQDIKEQLGPERIRCAEFQ